MKPFVKLTVAGLRGFVRDRAALFWSFFFPVFFIMIFGSIFGQSDKDKGIKFNVRVVMQDPSPQVAWLPGVFSKIPVLDSKTTDLNTARTDLDKGDATAMVVVPDGFAAHMTSREPTDIAIYTSASQPQTGPIVAGILKEVLNGVEKRMSDTPTLLRVSTEQSTPADVGPRRSKRQQRGIDFLLPGILAMTIMQLGLFTAIPIILMREKGILKRLRATPLPRGTIVGSQVAQRLTIALVQTFVIVALGVLMFQFQVKGSWPVLFGLIILGVLTFISIGAVLASVAKTQESGMSLVQLVNFPMMFLSGLFFPANIMPSFFQPVVKVLPATYLAEMLRYTMTGAPLSHSLAQCLAVLAAWLVGGLVVASRLFRWE